MREHASKLSSHESLQSKRRLLYYYASRRSHGEPLQYILGSEYFGDLEIKCRPGVLIPRSVYFYLFLCICLSDTLLRSRPETAASVSHLVHLLSTSHAVGRALSSHVRVLDLCTGTGCIPLLFHHNFYSESKHESHKLDLVGVDISQTALDLAKENRSTQLSNAIQTLEEGSISCSSLQNMALLRADVLCDGDLEGVDGTPSIARALRSVKNDDQVLKFDILISNPPYISPRDYKRTTRSVKDFEPKLALVPQSANSSSDMPEDGDVFYPRLLQIAESTEAKVALFEVSDLEQAQRVATMAVSQGIWTSVQIWRDDPGERVSVEEVVCRGVSVPVLGSGDGRSVVLYRDVGKAWLGA